MKQTVSSYDFVNAFQEIRPDNFSREALFLMFDWFEEYENSCGTEVELDVIGICCEFNEEDWRDIASNYEIDLTDCDDDTEREQTVEDHLHENTLFVGKTSGTMVYQAY